MFTEAYDLVSLAKRIAVLTKHSGKPLECAFGLMYQELSIMEMRQCFTKGSFGVPTRFSN